MHCSRVKSADGKFNASKIDTTRFPLFLRHEYQSLWSIHFRTYVCVCIYLYIYATGILYIYLFICRLARISSHLVSSTPCKFPGDEKAFTNFDFSYRYESKCDRESMWNLIKIYICFAISFSFLIMFGSERSEVNELWRGSAISLVPIGQIVSWFCSIFHRAVAKSLRFYRKDTQYGNEGEDEKRDKTGDGVKEEEEKVKMRRE